LGSGCLLGSLIPLADFLRKDVVVPRLSGRSEDETVNAAPGSDCVGKRWGQDAAIKEGLPKTYDVRRKKICSIASGCYYQRLY
jgi:hypothetical protein